MEAVIFIGIQGSGKSSFYNERWTHSARLSLGVPLCSTVPFVA